MAVDERFEDKQNIPTAPMDLNDPARFSQLIETAKDAFVIELTRYFDIKEPEFARLEVSVPTVQKYNMGLNILSEQPYETFVHLIQKYPDVTENTPLVAVTTANSNQKPIGIGGNFVDVVQLPARIAGSQAGPYAFQTGDKLCLNMAPNGTTLYTEIYFSSVFFADLTAATITEVVNAINNQSLYLKASAELSGSDYVLRLEAGGIMSVNSPNSIEIVAGSTTNALNVLGFNIGDNDSTVNHPPCNRYAISADMTIGLDVGADSDNERREISDLVSNLFTYDLDYRNYTWYGRSVFSESYATEWWQIIFKTQFAWSGESEVPRGPGSGDKVDMIWANRATVPITILYYQDREVSVGYMSPTLTRTDTLPSYDRWGDVDDDGGIGGGPV